MTYSVELLAAGALLAITLLQWLLHRVLGRAILLLLTVLISGYACYTAFVGIPNAIDLSIKDGTCFNCQMANSFWLVFGLPRRILLHFGGCNRGVRPTRVAS